MAEDGCSLRGEEWQRMGARVHLNVHSRRYSVCMVLPSNL